MNPSFHEDVCIIDYLILGLLLLTIIPEGVLGWRECGSGD
jgi:hypothetical protein